MHRNLIPCHDGGRQRNIGVHFGERFLFTAVDKCHSGDARRRESLLTAHHSAERREFDGWNIEWGHCFFIDCQGDDRDVVGPSSLSDKSKFARTIAKLQGFTVSPSWPDNFGGETVKTICGIFSRRVTILVPALDAN